MLHLKLESKDCIIPAIYLAAHGDCEVMLSQDFLIIIGAILASPVRMVNAPRRGLSQIDGHLQCPDRQILFHAMTVPLPGS